MIKCVTSSCLQIPVHQLQQKGPVFGFQGNRKMSVYFVVFFQTWNLKDGQRNEQPHRFKGTSQVCFNTFTQWLSNLQLNLWKHIFEMIDIGFVKYDLIKISTSCVSWPVCRRKLVCRGKLPYYLAQCALVRLTVLAARSQAKLFNPPLLCGNSVCFLTF